MHAITDKEKQEEAELELCCTEEQKKVLRGGYRFNIRASNKALNRRNERKQSHKEKRSREDYIVGGVDQNITEFVFLMLQCLVRKCRNTVLLSV